MTADARKVITTDWRCRSCFHKPKRGCALCEYWRDLSLEVAFASAMQCACGFASNVPLLVARHGCGR